MKIAITRSQLINSGWTKEKIKRYVKEGRLEESYGKLPETGQVVRCYQKTERFYER